MKKYTITLQDEVVKEAKGYFKEFGGKLSPLLNQLLIKWNEQQDPKTDKSDVDKINNEIEYKMGEIKGWQE